MDRCRGNSDRNDWSHCLSNGWYHRFLISDRFCVCTNDRCTDRRLLYLTSRFFKKICMYSEYACMGGRIYRISLADGCWYDPWKYTSRYDHYNYLKCDRKLLIWRKKIVISILITLYRKEQDKKWYIFLSCSFLYNKIGKLATTEIGILISGIITGIITYNAL